MGRAASKRGIFEGDIETGELEIGQIASAVDEIRPVSLIMKQLLPGISVEAYRTTLCMAGYNQLRIEK